MAHAQRRTHNARPPSGDRALRTTMATGAVGVEPTTARLTVECSAIELHPIGTRRATWQCNDMAAYDQHFLNAQTEGRTRILLRVRDFESRASASSAIWAT